MRVSSFLLVVVVFHHMRRCRMSSACDVVLCPVPCCAIDLLYSWLFSITVLNINSLNYCSSSDKSKRRTKTVKKSLEPKWNQTFMYSPVHRREFRERMLEITLWDQARVREEESEFLGEVSKPNPSRHRDNTGVRTDFPPTDPD